MSSLIFGIFFVLLAATVTFLLAADMAAHGNVVAADICRTGRAFCDRPAYLAAVTGGIGILWFALRERRG